MRGNQCCTPLSYTHNCIPHNNQPERVLILSQNASSIPEIAASSRRLSTVYSPPRNWINAYRNIDHITPRRSQVTAPRSLQQHNPSSAAVHGEDILNAADISSSRDINADRSLKRYQSGEKLGHKLGFWFQKEANIQNCDFQMER